MGDAFIKAFGRELECTQRIIASSCLFCVPQARSLSTDSEITQDDVYTHFLTPISSNSEHQPGQYQTLNGKCVSISGSHILTGKGFAEERKVRILLSETREIVHQEVTLLHLSRPLERGIALPEDPNEIDVATLRRYTAILRSFPENELVFYQLDQTIGQVKKICHFSNLYFTRYEHTLSSILREEWETSVEEIQFATFSSSSSSSSSSIREGREDGEVNDDSYDESSCHLLLPIQQVVECYLMENIYPFLFENLQIACYEEERKLACIMYQMRHFGPQDFGIKKEFQCLLLNVQKELIDVIETRKTPLDMLLGLKKCIDLMNETIIMNLKIHHPFVWSKFQLTTDDILDQLLYVLIQAFNSCYEKKKKPIHLPLFDMSKYPSVLPDKQNVEAICFPIVSILKYITGYHFINSNTTALGFTIANFQVAIEYFNLKYSKLTSQKISSTFCSEQTVALSTCETSHQLNWIQTKQALQQNDKKKKKKEKEKEEADSSLNQRNTMRKLFILGEWSTDDDDDDDEEEEEKKTIEDDSSLPFSTMNRCIFHRVPDLKWESKEEKIIQISGGNRFFGAITDQGKLYTWGDTHGGRLGHSFSFSKKKRLKFPQKLDIVLTTATTKTTATNSTVDRHYPSQQLPLPLKIVQVACGAFHTLVSDVNGHVYAWGQNARGQLGVLCHSFVTTTPTSTCTTPTTTTTTTTTFTTTTCSSPDDRNLSSSSCCEIHEPQLVVDLKGTYITSLACGEYHSLALSSQGQIFSWGSNQYSNLGRETKSFLDTLHPKAIETNWKSNTLRQEEEEEEGVCKSSNESDGVVILKIAAGKDHSIAITSENAVFTWGRGDDGQLGQGSFMDLSIPRQVMALSEHFQVVESCGGNSFSVFVTKQGFAYFCGYQGYRLLCQTAASNQETCNRKLKRDLCHALCPELLKLKEEDGKIISVSAGESHFALLTNEGKVLLGIREDISLEQLLVEKEKDHDDFLDQSNAWKIQKVEELEEMFVQRLVAGASHTLVVV